MPTAQCKTNCVNLRLQPPRAAYKNSNGVSGSTTKACGCGMAACSLGLGGRECARLLADFPTPESACESVGDSASVGGLRRMKRSNLVLQQLLSFWWTASMADYSGAEKRPSASTEEPPLKKKKSKQKYTWVQGLLTSFVLFFSAAYRVARARARCAMLFTVALQMAFGACTRSQEMINLIITIMYVCRLVLLF